MTGSRFDWEGNVGFNRGHFFSALAGLVVGVMLISALPALGAAGDNLVAGQFNDSGGYVTRLKGKGDPTLRLINWNSRAALELRVSAGTAPMKVNSDTLVANLNADLLDGMDSSAFHSGRTEFFLMMSGGETKTLVTHGSLSIDAACEADGDTAHQVSIYVDSSAAYYTFLTPHAAGHNLEVTWQNWQGVSNTERVFWVPSTGDAVWVYFGAVDQDIESTDCILVGRAETIGD